MAFPILGAVAIAIGRMGIPAAIKKYGPAAVKKAKKEIQKREAALDKVAKETTNRTSGVTPKTTAAGRREISINRNERGLAGEPLKKTNTNTGSRITNPTSYTPKAKAIKARLIEAGTLKPGMPGYRKGGKVRGAGIAQRGVRPAKMR
tara:strand:- start:1091 stop:1534 length:444 start_codon:yes stop_codon:yes gene_type:complete